MEGDEDYESTQTTVMDTYKIPSSCYGSEDYKMVTVSNIFNTATGGSEMYNVEEVHLYFFVCKSSRFFLIPKYMIELNCFTTKNCPSSFIQKAT